MFGIKAATVSKTIQIKPHICYCLHVFLRIVERPLKWHLNRPVKTKRKTQNNSTKIFMNSRVVWAE